jgi:hypothetical protein
MRAVTAARIALGAGGLVVFGVGARGLLTGHPFASNAPVGRWLLGGVIVHDGLIAPTTFLLGALAYRFTSVRVRRSLAAFLLVGGSVVIVALPDVLRKGLNSNTTVTPLDYTRNLAIVLAAVAAAALLIPLAGTLRARRRARKSVRAAEEGGPDMER